MGKVEDAWAAEIGREELSGLRAALQRIWQGIAAAERAARQAA